MTPCFTDEQGFRRVVLNPKIPVTPYVCLYCWNILDDSRAYCQRCGHSGTVFRYRGTSSQNCFTHTTKRAKNCCNQCNRAFCGDCLETNEGSSIMLGTYTYRCHLCIAEIESLQHQQTMRNAALCFRHPDTPVHCKCATCDAQLCRFCTYFPVFGLFSKRVDTTGYCFFCIRRLLFQHKIRYTVIEYFAGASFKEHMF